MKNFQIFSVPERLSTDITGFEFLGSIDIITYGKSNHTVVIDFAKTMWCEANLCSPLAAIIEDLRRRNNTVLVINFSAKIEEIFKRNGFYQFIENQDPLVESSGTITYQKFKLQDAGSFQNYIDEHLLTHKDFPKLSDKLRNKINKSLLEIFNNAYIHGGCEFVHTCGQYFPIQQTLKFTISDMGKTIRKNVNEFFNSGSSIQGKESIEWAVVEGNTTKNGSIPGGLGLSLIREFLTLNQGKLQIFSSNGYWEEKDKNLISKNCNFRLIGTIVTFEFNLKDNKSYLLTEEVDPTNIF